MVSAEIGKTMWEKFGRIIDPSVNPKWMVSHAAVALALPIGGDRFRIFFSPRDGQQRSMLASAVIDIGKPGRVEEVSEHPLLVPGGPGTFDDNGVMATEWV